MYAADTLGSSVYLDTDNNGAIDTIRWTFSDEADVTACAYEAGDWTVDTAGDMTVVITGLDCTGVNPYLDITVTADANETGKQTAAGDNPVISYANQGNPNDVTISSGNMGAHASVAITDSAKPLISSVDFQTVASVGGEYNYVTFNYTEAIVVSDDGGGDSDIAISTAGPSTATLGAMTTARTIEGIATWGAGNGGDMIQAAATVNTITHAADAANYLAIRFNSNYAGYFSGGTTAPTTPSVTPIEDANDITDLNENPVNSAQTAVVATNPQAWDVTVPTIVNTYSCDTDVDGDINRLQVNFSENMLDDSIAASDFEADNDNTNDGTGEETPASFNTATGGCDGAADDTDAYDEKIRLDLTTGISGTDAAYVSHPASTILRDIAGNILANGAGLGTENDKALPLLSSSTPANDTSGVSATGDIVLNFSEPIDVATDDFSLSNFGGTLGVTWSGGNAVATVDPSGTLGGGSHIFTITAADDVTGNAFGGAVAAAAEPFEFRVTASSSGGSSSTTTPTYSITLDAPDGDETMAAGTNFEITWTDGSTGTVSFIDLWYSTDGGTTYTQIADNTNNDGTYEWTVPEIDSETVTVKVEATDLADVLASDVSEAFAVSTTITETDEGETTTEEDSGEEAPGSGIYGNSPVTGEIEEISDIEAGSYFRANSYDTVYYLTEDGYRRPFMDAQTFFTYEDDFSGVLTVTDATLPYYDLGSPMLPNPGVVLVKIVSDVDVYAIEADPDNDNSALLRLIPDEETAIAIYGSDWADYVIDVDVTLFARFNFSEEEVDSDYDADTDGMTKREDLE